MCANLTTRNIVKMWWSTDPKLVGYADSAQQAEAAESDLLNSTPFRGTVRQTLTEIQRIRRNCGTGAYISFWIRTTDGRKVRIDDLSDAVAEADCRRAYREYA